jgi:D-ribose pyranose/furanose isomerase RbsD
MANPEVVAGCLNYLSKRYPIPGSANSLSASLNYELKSVVEALSLLRQSNKIERVESSESISNQPNLNSVGNILWRAKK